MSYSQKIQTETFPINGMSCTSCAINVEDILKKTSGVKSANVNFANKQATVEYDTAETSRELLHERVEAAGYELITNTQKSLQETGDELQEASIKKLKGQTITSLALAIPVAVIGMFFMHIPYANYIMLLLTTPVVTIIGFHFYKNAWKQLLHARANMDTLVAVSTGVAFGFSVFNTFYPQLLLNKGLHPHVYYEAAAIIIAFVSLGKWMEERAKSGTSIAIKKLIVLQAKTVRILTAEGVEKEINIESIRVGDYVLIKPGEKVAVDGIAIDGQSYIDESSITGEPVPAFKEKNSTVFAGTINQQGILTYKATKVGDQTVIAQIIRMVQQAQGSKAPVQKLVDKIAGVFVPVVLVISILTWIAWYFIGGEHSSSEGLLSAISVLVVACPCALGLATPTAIMVGIGKGAEHNILIKNAESLEQAHEITNIVLDKTGTITEGKPSVVELIWKNDIDANALSQILFNIENQSTHPLAHAVIDYIKKKQPLALTAFENIPGKGVRADYNEETYFIGNQNLINEHAIYIDSFFIKKTNQFQQLSYTTVYFSNCKEVLAIISIADKIKEHSKEAIKKLQAQGIEVCMLTGDNDYTAKGVATQVGIDHYKGDMLPNDKQQFIINLQKEGKKVAMVGDGINDSQALAQADVSIAIGKGSDIAIDVAQITLLTSDLLVIPNAIRLSSATVKIIRQNLFWAFIYNIIGIPIAAGILYPMWGITLNPMLASAAMALSSVSVVSNSLRLNYWK
ncbi:MAG TPA: heavy metal translocating P-type ATPase [Cytophaga sp.]|jgi:Cu2+-exporting ATPase|nr:heavy metal translocating P-type ATPase [Cytophaga sp.]